MGAEPICVEHRGRRHRRPLTEHEAIARAVKHCEAWGEITPHDASMKAFTAHFGPPDRIRSEDGGAKWLPLELCFMTVDQLRQRLPESDAEG